VSQGTASARPLRRGTRAALAVLALPAVFGLAACDGTDAAAPAAAVALGPATDSAAEHAAVCAKVEAAWAAFVPDTVTKDVGKIHGVRTTYIEIDYRDYDRLSIGLFDSLTGNREFQVAYAIDNLATDAGNVYDDPGQKLSPKPDLAAMKKDAPVVAAQCGTRLAIPAS
jgi:hypothetical protein